MRDMETPVNTFGTTFLFSSYAGEEEGSIHSLLLLRLNVAGNFLKNSCYLGSSLKQVPSCLKHVLGTLVLLQVRFRWQFSDLHLGHLVHLKIWMELFHLLLLHSDPQLLAILLVVGLDNGNQGVSEDIPPLNNSSGGQLTTHHPGFISGISPSSKKSLSPEVHIHTNFKLIV